MKVVHVLKRIETIDQDIRDLRKMEKALNKEKSFTNAIYISIEKQINILLGERIKLLELKIVDPPENLVVEIEGKKEAELKEEKGRSKKAKKTQKKSIGKKKPVKSIDDIPMLTQDQIDVKISSIKIDKEEKKSAKDKDIDDQSVKILDTALEHGTLNKDEISKTRERKVKFFRENFPAE